MKDEIMLRNLFFHERGIIHGGNNGTEIRLGFQRSDVFPLARGKIVDHRHPMTGLQERFDEVGADKAGPAGDKIILHPPILSSGERRSSV